MSQDNLRKLLPDLTDAELGALVREYIAESDHQGWDGWRKDQKTGINALFVDMYLFYSSLSPEELPLHGKPVTYGSAYDGPDQRS